MLDRLAAGLGVTVAAAVGSPIQLFDMVFSAGRRLAVETSARDVAAHPQVWMIDGTMEVTAGSVQWRLETGDCLAMQLPLTAPDAVCSHLKSAPLAA